MNIGNRIKNRRIELGLSVDEVAERLGKNRATVYRYENNDIENLPTTVLEPLARILGTTPAYLMGWEENTSFAELDIFDELMVLLGWEYKTFTECDGLAINYYLKDEDKVHCNGTTSIDACHACEHYQPYYYLTDGNKYYKFSKQEFDNLSSCLKPYLLFRINETISKKKSLTEYEYQVQEGLIIPEEEFDEDDE